MLTRAEKKAVGKGDVPTKKPPTLRAGLNTVTTSVENKKAQMVLIADDVDPTELVAFMPALCRKWGSLLHYQGEGQAGALCAQEALRHCCLPTGELGRQRSAG